MSGLARLGLAWRLLRAEGPAALAARAADRRLDAARRRRFAPLPAAALAGRGPAVEVLTVLPFPPLRRRGGVAIALLARLAAAVRERPTALLYREPGGFRLEVEGPGLAPGAIEIADDAATEGEERDWTSVVDRAAAWLGAHLLHFESLAELPLAPVAGLARGPRPLVVSTHDFALHCVRPHLDELPERRFCHFSRDRSRCAACLGNDADRRGTDLDAHRRAASEIVAHAAALVHPSRWVAARHAELFPGLEPARQRVIAPALAPPAPTAPTARWPPRHVAFAGAARADKGALVFAELARRSEIGGDLRWSALGGGESAALAALDLAGVRVRGYYAAGTLPARLGRERVDLVILPVRTPETYSLVLDECIAAGVPVLASDLGALGERVRELGAGWCVPSALGLDGLAAKLREILSGALPRPDLTRAAAALSVPEQAARAHDELYLQIAAPTP
ncbi:MAG: glycosyltransferase [Thermoanaerobaculia bacterium]